MLDRPIINHSTIENTIRMQYICINFLSLLLVGTIWRWGGQQWVVDSLAGQTLTRERGSGEVPIVDLF